MTTPTATSASPSSTSTNTASATNTSAVNSTPTVKPQTPAGTVTNNTSNTINTNNCASGSAAQPSAFTHNHEYIPTEVIAPTTTNYGYTLYTCKTCGDQQRDNYQEPIQCTHEHAVKTDVKPSCTVSGCTLIDCPDCGAATQSDITPATGHIWNDGEIIQAPTCAATGSIKYTCTKCGEIRISSVPATGHSYTDEIVEPTCEQVGYVVHTCSTCGTSNTEHTCGELGHDITFTVISPTATEQGYTLYECRRCGATVTGDYTSPTGTVSAGQQCGNNQAGTQQQPISAQPTLPQTHDYAAVVATGNSWLASNGYTVGGTDSFCPDIRYMRTKDSQGALESTMISVCINSVNAAKKTIASDPAISDAMFHCDCYQDGDTVVLSCWHSFVAAPDIELVFW